MSMKHLLAWVPMIIIAIANGLLREFTYGKHLTELRAHQVSTVTAIALFTLYIWGLLRLWRFKFDLQALAVGLTWLLLTVTFEFGFGNWVAGHPWNSLLHDYNLAAGRLWALIPAWVAIAPWLLHRLQRQRREQE